MCPEHLYLEAALRCQPETQPEKMHTFFLLPLFTAKQQVGAL